MCLSPKFPHFKPSDNIHNVIYTDIQFCKFQVNVDFISAISNILDIIHYSAQPFIMTSSTLYQYQKLLIYNN